MQPRAVVGLAPPPSIDSLALPKDWEPGAETPSDPPPGEIGTYWKAMTSGGSTGRPKVIIHHSPPALDPETPSQGFVLNDTVLIPAPLYHNAPFSLSHMALCWGAHVIEMERFDAVETLRLIERHRVRWLYVVPTMMHRIWSLPPEIRGQFDVSSLEFVVHMAAPCAPWLKEAWIDWIGPDKVWELYAGTESLGGTVISGREWLAHRGSVGRCYIGSLKILNAAGQPCAPGEVGDIYFKPPGDRPPFHYLGADAVVKDGWQTYGDLGWLDAEAYLYLADRRTDMVVSGGANIYPAEVEAALDAHPSVASSVCVGLPDADLGHRLHAIVEMRPGPVPSAEDLEAFLGGRLARYKIPYTFEIALEPLRDDAGKVRRLALRDVRVNQVAAGASFPSLRSARQPKD
jgi:bile acid-coenzyme A ligase